MRKSIGSIVVILIFLCVGIVGCGEVGENETKNINKIEDEVISEEEIQEFEYKKSDGGIVLTKYNGNDDKIIIPDEIDGKVVIGVDNTMFENCSQLTSVQFPSCIEKIQGGIFKDFPNVIIVGYENTKCEEISLGENRALQSLGENIECIKYIDVYDSETKGVMNYTRLMSGENGKEGEYSEGTSFVIKDGVATLTLNNYNGGN